IDSTRSWQSRTASTFPAVGLRMITVSVARELYSGALVFASNWGCVTSEGAKIPPAGSDRSGGIDWTRCGGFAWRESVCAITRGTRKDSAGTESQPWRSAQNSQHEHHS